MSIRKNVLVLAAAISAFVAVQGVHAQQNPPDRRNVLSFSTSVSEDVTQDLLIVTLEAQKEGTVAADVQAWLKQQLDTALTQARKAAQPQAMEVRTGSFSIHPRYNNQGRINGWQGQAQLVLQGTDMARIAQTAGRINQLNIVSVNYGLSRALREQFESSLTAKAIEGFRARAQSMSKAFGFERYTLGEVNVQSGEPGFEGRPMPMLKAAMADSASAPLPVEPGKGTVTVTVSGHVILAP